ncbi:hypothetical protein ACFYWS_20430 [Streptomyces sp. NPDC002795]|uniref:hypothetical protein n=1 Tax=Streptomyces sp. NPDC002795 TaxID=3364665 RepID=UPI0036C967F6
MTIRGRSTGVLACIAAAVLLSGCTDSSPKPPTNKEIKASAQARIDRSLLDGRKAQLAIVQNDITPSGGFCQKLWDKKPKADQKKFTKAAWLSGCVDSPESP